MTTTESTVPRFTAPFDEEALADAVMKRGAAVVEGVYSPETVAAFLRQVDELAETSPEEIEYADDSLLSLIMGENTSTLHSLISAVPLSREMVVHPILLGCARRLLAPLSDTVLLSGCELFDRAPGTPFQELHRDTFCWIQWPGGPTPIAMTVLAAMSDFTAENGATWVTLDAYDGPPDGEASEEQRAAAVQVEMALGDALILRSDNLHGGGANVTEDDHRKLFSVMYQVGWLRPLENATLSSPPALAATFDRELQDLLGYSSELVLGLYKGSNPRNALRGL